ASAGEKSAPVPPYAPGPAQRGRVAPGEAVQRRQPGRHRAQSEQDAEAPLIDSRPAVDLKTQASGGRTYSNSTGIPLMPLAGAATHDAIFPGSTTGCMSDFTNARSSAVGSHSPSWPLNSASEINF